MADDEDWGRQFYTSVEDRVEDRWLGERIMNRRWTLAVAAVAAVCLTVSHAAWGQQSGSNRTSGSGRTTGFGSGNATAGSASTLSQAQGYGLDSRFTGSGFNRFMTGSAGMGETTAGAAAATSGAFGQSAAQGQASGQNRFGNLGGMGNFGLGGMMGMRNMFGRNAQMTNQQQTGKVRTHMRLGFDRPQQPSGAVNARFSRVITRVLERPDIGGGQVTVSMEGSTAVLTGTVATEHVRGVLENLAMLEPGIEAVRNELLVDPAVPKPASEPTSRAVDQRQ